jgi:short-subunit dehydrogenase
MSKYVSSKMIPGKQGRIVNISCIRSAIYKENMADYAASKAGVSALTSVMALDLAQYKSKCCSSGLYKNGYDMQSI